MLPGTQDSVSKSTILTINIGIPFPLTILVLIVEHWSDVVFSGV